VDPNEPFIQVTDEGRVGGYFFQADACLLHDHEACPKASPTQYAAFHQQSQVLDSGEMLRVGVIGNTHGHADPYGTIEAAQAHYSDPSAQLMVGRAGDNEHGGWFAGVLVPDLTYGDVALIRRCALSGDWRPMPQSWWAAHGIPRRAVAECEGYDCIGPTFVNRPGLPLVRQYARTAATLARWAPSTPEVTVIVTLPNGTVIDGENESVESIVAAMQAAGPPTDAPEEEAPADPMAEYDTRLAAVEEALGQVVEWINGQQEAQAAAIEAALLPLPEAANA
jgi:hypothetical protein